jgi:nuclear pore complex protein Nup155
MKLLILHVSEHRDENIVQPIWSRIIDDGKPPVFCSCVLGLTMILLAMGVDSDPQAAADRIISKVIPLGQRFYPSQSAFPLRECLTVFHNLQQNFSCYFTAQDILQHC